MDWLWACFELIDTLDAWTPIGLAVIVLDTAFIIILMRWDDVRKALWG